jgi:hypothetical protein
VPDRGKKVPTHEEIAARAFEIYLKRGGERGGELEDWLAAEKELIESRETDVPEPTMPDVTPLRKRARTAKR